LAHRVISLLRSNRVALGKADINFGAPWRPIPRRLRHGPRGHGVEALRSPLSRRPIERLDQGEEPKAPGRVAGHGCVFVIRAQLGILAAFPARRRIHPAVGFGRLFRCLISRAVAGPTLFLNRNSTLHRSLRCIGAARQTDQSFFELAASLANRSALRRSKFLRSAICSFSYSVSPLSVGRNMLFASFSRLLMA
jgi:hypothetical protein